jgi:hypothetical protein
LLFIFDIFPSLLNLISLYLDCRPLDPYGDYIMGYTIAELVSIPGRDRNCLLASIAITPTLSPSQNPIECIPRVLFLQEQRNRRVKLTTLLMLMLILIIPFLHTFYVGGFVIKCRDNFPFSLLCNVLSCLKMKGGL